MLGEKPDQGIRRAPLNRPPYWHVERARGQERPNRDAAAHETAQLVDLAADAVNLRQDPPQPLAHPGEREVLPAQRRRLVGRFAQPLRGPADLGDLLAGEGMDPIGPSRHLGPVPRRRAFDLGRLLERGHHGEPS